jgi:hypothetical protein
LILGIRVSRQRSVDNSVNYLILKDTAFLVLPAKISEQPETDQEIPIKISPRTARGARVVPIKISPGWPRLGPLPGKDQVRFQGLKVQRILPTAFGTLVTWCGFRPARSNWHGAAATLAVTHIAIRERLNGKVVDWMEKGTDEQHQAGSKTGIGVETRQSGEEVTNR